MSWLWVFTIIFGVLATILLIGGILVNKFTNNDGFIPMAISLFVYLTMVVFFILAIAIPISVKKEMLRYEKERQQIIYQIENLTADKDKIKLNEWILTYNDWVNDVNTSKETYGWFSKYYNVDMSEHTVIDLV